MLAASSMALAGPFELLSPLGSGGMGVVWRGRHVDRGHPVAIKSLSDRRAADALFVEAFHAEVQVAAALAHEHVVQVYDVGQVGYDAEIATSGAFRAGAP